MRVGHTTVVKREAVKLRLNVEGAVKSVLVEKFHQSLPVCLKNVRAGALEAERMRCLKPHR